MAYSRGLPEATVCHLRFRFISETVSCERSIVSGSRAVVDADIPSAERRMANEAVIGIDDYWWVDSSHSGGSMAVIGRKVLERLVAPLGLGIGIVELDYDGFVVRAVDGIENPRGVVGCLESHRNRSYCLPREMRKQEVASPKTGNTGDACPMAGLDLPLDLFPLLPMVVTGQWC